MGCSYIDAILFCCVWEGKQGDDREEFSAHLTNFWLRGVATEQVSAPSVTSPRGDFQNCVFSHTAGEK